ncbi:hypothetical protein BDZ89DRAFT_279019 [Hymenopellis radicata]|nr:hypothetical protein BDZ89DRAFT_279019 [Hymenopellis radicata]
MLAKRAFSLSICVSISSSISRQSICKGGAGFATIWTAGLHLSRGSVALLRRRIPESGTCVVVFAGPALRPHKKVRIWVNFYV